MKILILAGGGGIRLFPLSRDRFPKQFIKLVDNESLFQKTLKRALKLVKNLEDVIILTNKDYVFYVKNQVAEIGYKNIFHLLLEPEKRNTAPSIALGIKYLMEKDLIELEEPLFVFPTDQLIKPENAFIECLLSTPELIQEGYILTFGIIPKTPETGYGYIEADKEIKFNLKNGKNAYKVRKFHEKPNLDIARIYLERGNFYWNSGIFGFNARTFLTELKTHAESIYELINEKSVNEIINNYSSFPDISIDYAIMEKSEKIIVLPLELFWTDLGSFEALYEVMEKDEKGNAVCGKVIAENTSNSLILGNKRLVLSLGVEDIFIVETEDVLLVAKKGEGQNIKTIVSKLKKDSLTKTFTEVHPTEIRPWGSFTVVEVGEGYKIKKIVVNPGESISLQMHFHRSEHWVVVKGTALVLFENEKGELKEHYIRENESFFVPKTCKHRLINPGKIPLEIVEVQVGEYVGEDDIVRFEDKYERN